MVFLPVEQSLQEEFVRVYPAEQAFADRVFAFQKLFGKSPQIGGRNRLLGVFVFDDVDDDKNGNADQTKQP